MLPFDALTSKQKQVARHGDGPAVVVAVPGAGKTTALVHRIRFLVTERNVSPSRLLVCSFGRDTVQDLSDALAALGVEGVSPRTFHSLGHALLRQADAPAPPADAPDPDTAARRLARRALDTLAAERNVDRTDLGISPADLADQVAAWKQQLAYAAPDRADLPPAAASVARTAQHDNDDLISLFDHFERHRRQTGWRTYADLLRDGWAALMRDDALRTRMQDKYDYVLVDEFQDVSRAPYEILDGLTAPHRNYMVVGDDDQCIYRWRGAQPSFLLDFAERYDADTYAMTASFRLPLAPLALANNVIAHNDNRHPKRIDCTRGTAGTARVLDSADAKASADALADTVEALLDDDYTPADLVVLVRTYGQTPPLERAFLACDRPYRIAGHVPFYRRRPVQTLLRYLYWAVLERRRRRRGGFDRTATARQYRDRFVHIVNRPSRYVRRERLDVITREAQQQQSSVLDVMAAHLPDMPDDTRERAAVFLDVAEALVDRLDENAGAVLADLVATIDYESALREQSVRAKQGEARVRTVRAFVRYADAFDRVPALLRGVKALADAQGAAADPGAAVAIRSIHRAKGAEWPVVFVPGCVEGTLPYAPDADNHNLAEERRLFYVAATRARDRLYLGTRADADRSRFLEEADPASTLPRCQAVGAALQSDPDALTTDAVARLCYGIATLDLEPYIRHWWTPSADRVAALRPHLDDVAAAMEAAEARLADYRDAKQQHAAAASTRRDKVQDRVDRLRDRLGTTVLPVRHETPDTHYPDDASFTFAWTDDETRIEVYRADTVVGTLHPLDAGRLDTDTLLNLPWSHLVGTFDGCTQNRTRLHVALDWDATADRMLDAEREAHPAPTPPDDRTRRLAGDAVRTGYTILRDRLSQPVS